jgi:hypothetical protein
MTFCFINFILIAIGIYIGFAGHHLLHGESSRIIYFLLCNYLFGFEHFLLNLVLELEHSLLTFDRFKEPA